MPLIQAEPLTAAVTAIFTAVGTTEPRARQVAEHLVEANLQGHDSHGIGMVPHYVLNAGNGCLDVNADVAVVSDHGAVLHLDGQLGFGQVVGQQAMALAIQRVRETGVVCMGLKNAHHLGRIGAYGETAAAAGLVSLQFVNTVGHTPQVAPFGGRERRMTTNPVCMSLPRPDGNHVVLDMATSAIALGKVRVAHHKGVPVPEGSLIDAAGRPTTDPSVMFSEPQGALGPFGAHKGYGLALMCELLGGGIVGQWTAQPGHTWNTQVANNVLAFVLDPAVFGSLEAIEAELDAMLGFIHSTAPADGVDRVRVPGDPERESRAARLAEGIPVDDSSWATVVDAAARVGIDDLGAFGCPT